MGEAYVRMIPSRHAHKKIEKSNISADTLMASLEKDEEDSVEKADDDAQLIQKTFLHTKLRK